MVITSKSNPFVKKVASLKEKKFRKEYSLFLVEGVKMVREVLSSEMEVESIVYSSEYEGETFLASAVEVSPAVFEFLSDERTPQGILAVVKIPKNQAFIPKGNCLLLDRIRDPGNLGTIVRTANAAGYKEIYAISSADFYSPKCVRAAMSGLFFVNVFEGDLSEILPLLKGVPILCADMDGENIFSFTPPKQLCLAVGNEGEGLSDEVFSAATSRISIPMEKEAESLNAGVSAGIAMYVLKHFQKSNL